MKIYPNKISLVIQAENEAENYVIRYFAPRHITADFLWKEFISDTIKQ